MTGEKSQLMSSKLILYGQLVANSYTPAEIKLIRLSGVSLSGENDSEHNSEQPDANSQHSFLTVAQMLSRVRQGF
jgi:hypothetical protein